MSGHGMSEGWPRPHRALMGLRIAGFAVMGVVGAAIFALAFGWLAMLLWNWVMPSIFHLGEITYWEAFGLVILGKLIFGGFGFRGGHGMPSRRGGPWKGAPWGGNPWGGHPWGGGPWAGRSHGPNEWRLYRDFWEQEGRKAFDSFVEKRKAETGSEPKDA